MANIARMAMIATFVTRRQRVVHRPSDVRCLTASGMLWINESVQYANTDDLDMDLSNNNLTGEILSDEGIANYWADLGQLELLVAFNNSFGGTMSTHIGNISAIPVFDSLAISGNQFSGSLPSELGILTSLTTMNLAYNEFAGQIPSELENIERLGGFWESFVFEC